MNVISIIQARMSSSRLPNKVLLDLEGKPVLERIYQRLQRSKIVDKIVIATSDDISDDPIGLLCSQIHIPIYRGSLDDVLSRFYFAAQLNNADIIVRITGDCPVVDAGIVDELIEKVLTNSYDYACLSGEFPDGLDCSVMTFDSLEDAHLNARLASDREHVCPFIEKQPQKFKIYNYYKFTNLGHHRWTLDEEDDYKLIGEIFKNLVHKNKYFNYQDILNFLENNPLLKDINSHIARNEGYQKSLADD